MNRIFSTTGQSKGKGPAGLARQSSNSKVTKSRPLGGVKTPPPRSPPIIMSGGEEVNGLQDAKKKGRRRKGLKGKMVHGCSCGKVSPIMIFFDFFFFPRGPTKHVFHDAALLAKPLARCTRVTNTSSMSINEPPPSICPSIHLMAFAADFSSLDDTNGSIELKLTRHAPAVAKCSTGPTS